MTAPNASSTVSGIVVVAASSTAVAPASIASVQFYLDESPLGFPCHLKPVQRLVEHHLFDERFPHPLCFGEDNYSSAATSSPITVTVANQAVLSVTTSTSFSFTAAHGSIYGNPLTLTATLKGLSRFRTRRKLRRATPA